MEKPTTFRSSGIDKTSTSGNPEALSDDESEVRSKIAVVLTHHHQRDHVTVDDVPMVWRAIQSPTSKYVSTGVDIPRRPTSEMPDEYLKYWGFST